MVAGNLSNELGPHSLHKLLALTNWHHERTQAANHAVAVVEVEVLDVPITPSFEHDRKAVDDDPPVEGLIPGVRDGSAWLLAPSPLMSMTRRAASTPLPSRSRTLQSMAAEIEVRGARRIGAAA